MNYVLTPDEIAKRGEEIYRECFQDKYEGKQDGKYLAIDVENKKEYLGDYSEDALLTAKRTNPNAILYLIRIGEETAFRVGYTGIRNNGYEGIFQQAT